MSVKLRSSLLSLTTIVVIVFSAFGTTTVYADGDPPPDAPPTEATSPPDESGSATTVTTSDTVTEASSTQETDASADPATEATPADATATPDPAAEPTATEAAPAADAATPPATEEVAPTADASLLTAVPENTTVTVVDANGDAQPLATQEAAAAIATSDPIWCPQGSTPTPGTGGCTGSFSSFDALLKELEANPTTYQGPGTIYVEQGAYQGGEQTIDFNAYNLGNINTANLTVTGGWNTSTGGIDPTAPSTFNGTSIIIGSSTSRWGGSLTVNNITISNTDGTGLTLFAQNNITVSNVNVTNSTNGSGAELDAGVDVNVNNSNFTRNKKSGATVRAGSNVAVAKSSFSNPANARRQNTGLDVTAVGSVSLFDVLANENRVDGAIIRTTSGAVSIGGTALVNGTCPSPDGICGSVFSNSRDIQGTKFLGSGLTVVTPATISLDNVTANNNFLWGASLDSGSIISISNSIFNGNTTSSRTFIDDTGLFILRATDVSLNNVEASRNRLFGAQIMASGTVSINDSFFNSNRGSIDTGFNGHGLQVTTTAGNIFINRTEATNNVLFGAELNASGNVDIAGSNFSNTSTGDPNNAMGVGLKITSGGDVTLSSIVAPMPRPMMVSGNQTDGAVIQAAGNIYLDDVTATNNGSNGLTAQGSCVVVIGGTYTGNGGAGLDLGSSPVQVVSPPAGDITPANPAVCTLLLASTNPVNNLFAVAQPVSLDIAAQQDVANTNTGNGSNTVTLKNVVAKSMGNHFGVFIGKYAAVYSSSGMQIIAFAPAASELALH